MGREDGHAKAKTDEARFLRTSSANATSAASVQLSCFALSRDVV